MGTLGEYLGAGSGVTKGLYHLNGSSADSSGNGNNGTDTAITYSLANGKFGQGAGFGGSSTIQIPNATLSFGTGEYTVSCWYKGNNTQTALITSNTAANAFLFALFIWTSGGILYGTTSNTRTTTGTINDGNWHNIVSTRTSSTISLYVDGVLVDSGSSTNQNVNTSINKSFIGSQDGSSFLSNGTTVDEVITENVAWNAVKVKKQYTYAKGRFGII